MLFDKFKNQYQFKSKSNNYQWVGWVIGIAIGALIIYFFD